LQKQLVIAIEKTIAKTGKKIAIENSLKKALCHDTVRLRLG
jgi:hypothetical protein